MTDKEMLQKYIRSILTVNPNAPIQAIVKWLKKKKLPNTIKRSDVMKEVRKQKYNGIVNKQ